MYVRVTADYTGEARQDKANADKALTCGPLRASFVVEKLYFNFIPCTTLYLVLTCVVVLLLFWLVGLPLLTWALGPQIIDKTKEGKKKD